MENLQNTNNKQKIIQICRNRWTEGIFDISHEKIESNKVELNQGEVPDLTSAKNFNDLDQAWIKARKELLLAFPKESSFRQIGYDLIKNEFFLGKNQKIVWNFNENPYYMYNKINENHIQYNYLLSLIIVILFLDL